MIKEIEYPLYSSGGLQRVSWGAIFAGAVMSLAVMVALTALGAGIGLASTPLTRGAGAAMGLGIGSGLWMLLSGVASFYAGGWIAGRLTGIARVSESVIHGLLAWSVATVMMAFVFTTATVGAFGAAANVVGSTLDASWTTVEIAEAAPDAERAAKAGGAAGIFVFLMLGCDAVAAGYGARAGTRVLKPVPVTEPRRERIGV